MLLEVIFFKIQSYCQQSTLVTARRQYFDKCFRNKENAGSWKPVRMSFVRILASPRAGSEISWDCAKILIFKKYSNVAKNVLFSVHFSESCHARYCHCQEIINQPEYAFVLRMVLNSWTTPGTQVRFLHNSLLDIFLRPEPDSHVFTSESASCLTCLLHVRLTDLATL